MTPINVGFKVRVIGNADVENEATITENGRVVKTNKVQTEVIPLPPQTGDNSNIHLCFVLMFISSGAILTLILSERKREMKEKN